MRTKKAYKILAALFLCGHESTYTVGFFRFGGWCKEKRREFHACVKFEGENQS